MFRKCILEECDKIYYSKGYCQRHYDRSRRHGDPRYSREIKKILKCSVEACERKQKSNGYCSTHGAKIRRSGTLEYIRETKEYKEKWLEKRITDLSRIDKIRDLDPKRRGFYAVRIVNELKTKAKSRNIKWDLQPIEAYRLIIAQCHYCGWQPEWPRSRCGLDRIDNTRGYHADNVVSCCVICNTAKGSQSVEEFKNWIHGIYQNFISPTKAAQ